MSNKLEDTLVTLDRMNAQVKLMEEMYHEDMIFYVKKAAKAYTYGYLWGCVTGILVGAGVVGALCYG